MTDSSRSCSSGAFTGWALGALLAAGMVAAAFVLGTQFKNIRQPGTITVKGLAESTHKADWATWQVGVRVWAPDYRSALHRARQDVQDLRSFVDEQGFEQTEVLPLEISPHTESYRDAQGEYQSRQNGFVAEQSIHIATGQLSKLGAAVSALQQLKADHEHYTLSAPQYLLQDLEAIKRSLIAQATADARNRAEEFARSGQARIGHMKKASQGAFNIYALNRPEEHSDYGGTYDKTSVDKKVRLVVTIEYGID